MPQSNYAFNNLMQKALPDRPQEQRFMDISKGLAGRREEKVGFNPLPYEIEKWWSSMGLTPRGHLPSMIDRAELGIRHTKLEELDADAVRSIQVISDQQARELGGDKKHDLLDCQWAVVEVQMLRYVRKNSVFRFGPIRLNHPGPIEEEKVLVPALICKPVCTSYWKWAENDRFTPGSSIENLYSAAKNLLKEDGLFRAAVDGPRYTRLGGMQKSA